MDEQIQSNKSPDRLRGLSLGRKLLATVQERPGALEARCSLPRLKLGNHHQISEALSGGGRTPSNGRGIAAATRDRSKHFPDALKSFQIPIKFNSNQSVADPVNALSKQF